MLCMCKCSCLSVIVLLSIFLHNKWFNLLFLVVCLESSVQLKEERTVFDMDYKSSAPEATSTSHHEDKNILLGGKERALNVISRVDCTTSKMSKLARDLSDDIIVTFETKEQLHPVDKTLKRKRKPTISKVIVFT